MQLFNIQKSFECTNFIKQGFAIKMKTFKFVNDENQFNLFIEDYVLKI